MPTWNAIRKHYAALLREADCTQEEVAARGGIKGQNTISRMLRNTRRGPTIETLTKAVAGLGLSLRHSYLTELYRVTRDEATVARAALHAVGSPMTARYTRGAHDDVDRAAQVAFSAALKAQRKVSQVSAKGVRAGKMRRIS